MWDSERANERMNERRVMLPILMNRENERNVASDMMIALVVKRLKYVAVFVMVIDTLIHRHGTNQ